LRQSNSHCESLYTVSWRYHQCLIV
jgi:hypothetical protein